jgi:hypothetical protein
MKYTKAIIFLVLLQLLSNINLKSQEGTYVEVRDLESWTSAKINLKANKNWTFGLLNQVRLDNNSTELKSFITQLNTEFKFSKKFEMAMGLRHTLKNDNEGEIQGNENYFRMQLDASFKHKINRFVIKHRFRYTNQNELGISKEEGDYPEKYLRFKSSVDYNIKDWKLDPEFSAEIFSRHVKYGQFNGLDFFRLSFGTSYKLKSFGKIGLQYRLEREINTSYPKTTNIFQVKYAYTIKMKKK